MYAVNCYNAIEGKNFQEMGKWTEYLNSENKIDPRGSSVPALELYTCI